jgi:hypothetical protein
LRTTQAPQSPSKSSNVPLDPDKRPNTEQNAKTAPALFFTAPLNELRNAKDAGAASTVHLPRDKTEIFGVILGDGMPLWHLGRLDDGFRQALSPIVGGSRGAVDKE